MVGKLTRRLREIDAEIGLVSDKRERLHNVIELNEMKITCFAKQIDRFTGPSVLGYSGSLDDQQRCNINALADLIGACYLKIRQLRNEIDICDSQIASLREEREVVSERLDELMGQEQYRELDVIDFQLMIDKQGFIHGIKL